MFIRDAQRLRFKKQINKAQIEVGLELKGLIFLWQLNIFLIQTLCLCMTFLCITFSCVFLVHSNECITDLDSLTQYMREQEEEQERLQRGTIYDVLPRFGI